MRAIGASEKMPSVSAGRKSCLRLAQKTSTIARDQAVDEIRIPSTVGGGFANTSSRPSGAGAQPSR